VITQQSLSGKGTSTNPCSDIYRYRTASKLILICLLDFRHVVYCFIRGPSPASEPEISSVQKFVYDNKDKFKLFLTFHSYSQVTFPAVENLKVHELTRPKYPVFQMLFLPWGYDNVRVDDYDDLVTRHKCNQIM
jgi:hypothetical protein